MDKNFNITSEWHSFLKKEFNKEYFEQLTNFVLSEYHANTVYPLFENIFEAFNLCPFKDLKVVILGQDPYHNPHQAHGLSFSVPSNIPPPPSLVNIYKELNNDIGMNIPPHGNLTSWAKQGVLLLNSVLTVRENEPTSHKNRGWEKFTDAVIEQISIKKEHVVFLLWGGYAIKKGKKIDLSKHDVLSSAHPSPLSVFRGFSGNKHFSKTNELLKKKGHTPIKWDSVL